MLRHQSRGSEFAKLQFSFDTKQGGATANERRPGGHTHITRLNVFDNFIFFTFVGEFEVFVVEFKSGVGVIRHIEFHFVAHGSRNGGLNFLVEIEIGFSTSGKRQSGVVGFVAFHTHINLKRTGGFQLHTTGTEHRLQRTKPELHIQEIEGLVFLLFNRLIIFLTIIFLHRLTQSNIIVFVGRKDEWGKDIVVAQFGAHHIMTGFGIEFGSGGDVGGRFQIGGRLHKLELIIGIRHFVVCTVGQIKGIFRHFVAFFGGNGRWRCEFLFSRGGLGLRHHIATECE